MNRLVCAFFLLSVMSPCGAQTLQGELKNADIPATSFTRSELAQTVNAASARDSRFSYLVYMRVNGENQYTGNPLVVRADLKSGSVIRKEMSIGDEQNCCGSPLAISFTRNFELFAFHLTPSASTIVVMDCHLKPTEILYGIGVWEIAPDEVIFTEDMIHFAAAHPERLMLADLRTGATQELYPSQGDPLRTAFARDHVTHMPPQAVCMAMNDPCDPETYDETIEFVSADAPEKFALRVSRNALHSTKQGEPPDAVLGEQATYFYERRKGKWFYCDLPITGAPGEKSDCRPDLPVQAVGRAQFPGPLIKKVN